MSPFYIMLISAQSHGTMVYDNPKSLMLPIQNHLAYTVFSLMLIILCFLILYSVYNELFSRKQGWYTVEKDEYNFMAEEASEQSRLDLATAYLEIDQLHEAKLLLEELLNSKNPITKEKAKQLLKKIKAL